MKFNHNRIKPKYSSKKKHTISQEDRDYLEYLQTQSFNCFVCGTGSNIEMHHIKEHSNNKKNHKELIPLCVMHHRLSNELSAHGTATKFKKLYPMEVQRVQAKEIYLEYELNIF